MDKSTPEPPIPGTYVDIENRIIDKYMRRIGVYGFAVYCVIQWHLSQEPPHEQPSYAAIARKLGIDQGAVIRHVKTLQRLRLSAAKPWLQRRAGSVKRWGNKKMCPPP